jgi:hypothetical protein
MIHDREKEHGFQKIMTKTLTTSSCGFLNDQIWTLVSKVLVHPYE